MAEEQPVKKSCWRKRKVNPDLIEQSIGPFSGWHVWICFWLFIAKLPMIMHQIVFVVICEEEVFNCANGNKTKCDPTCPSLVWDRKYFDNTVVKQWNLVCDKHYLVDLLQTILMTGLLFGNLSFGFWADKQGRKMPLIVGCIGILVFSVLSAFTPWLWLLFVLKFLTGFSVGGTMPTGLVLLVELAGSKWRVLVLSLNQLMVSVGYALVAPIAYFCNDWQCVQLGISAFSVLAIAYIWAIPESPRWLLAAGKKDKAIKVITKAAKCNKNPTDAIQGNIDQYLAQMEDRPKTTGNFLDLFRTVPMRVKTLVMMWAWFVCGMCYYCITQMSGHLSGNLYLNIALLGISQAPSVLLTIPTLEIFGRKITIIGGFVIASVSFIVFIFLPQEGFGRIICSFIGMFGVSISFNDCYIYSGEIFPTVIRNIGCGTCSTVARIGSIIAPHVASLDHYTYDWVTPAIVATLPVTAAALSVFLPETKNIEHLPDTVAEADEHTWRTRELPPT